MEILKNLSFLIVVVFSAAILFPFASPSYTFYTAFLDYNCNFKVNHTAVKQSKNFDMDYSECHNMTFKDDGRNHTVGEFRDCLMKCYVMKSEILDKTKKFDGNRFNEYFKKYSNATPSYIKKVASLFEDCVGKAKKENDLKTSSSDDGDCVFYRSFDECSIRRIMDVSLNATQAVEFCPDTIRNSTQFLTWGEKKKGKKESKVKKNSTPNPKS